jgi:hypothetical protein
MSIGEGEGKALFGRMAELLAEYQARSIQPVEERLVLTNQMMINFFFAAFGGNAWAKIEACGLAYMAQDKLTRAAVYSGPNVFELPLAPAEQQALVEAINQGLS